IDDSAARDLAGNYSLPTCEFRITVGYSVDPNGGADYSSIQAAIDALSSGDAIICATGSDGDTLTYYEAVNFKGKDIVLVTDDPYNTDAIYNTVINANTAPFPGQPAVRFAGTETEDCEIRGFRIQGGAGNFDNVTMASYGGGIYGGSISGAGTKATISNNIITANLATYGAGIYNCDGLIINNVITQNGSGTTQGAGLHSCDGQIYNNDILGNQVTSTGSGGGLYNCQGDIRNNIIYYNEKSGGASDQIASSAAPTYCCIEDWASGGTGNFSSNPQFVDLNNDDLHLSASSPCIDAGQFVTGATIDAEGDARPMDGKADGQVTGDGSDIDIGFDEYTGTVPALPLLQMTPSTELTGAGDQGGPFKQPITEYPTRVEYQITNVGNETLDWTFSADVTWVSADQESGSLIPGNCAFVTVDFNDDANLLTAGQHTGAFHFNNTNNGLGTASRSVTLDVDAVSGDPALLLNPIAGFNAEGPEDGPFDPEEISINVRNDGGGVMDWSTSSTVNWLSCSSDGGALGANNSTDVNIYLNENVYNLKQQNEPYEGNMWFFNNTNGDGDTSITVAVTVHTPGPYMRVSADEDFETEGYTGGPFDPAEYTYYLSNEGDAPYDFTVSIEYPPGGPTGWVDIIEYSVGTVQMFDMSNTDPVANTSPVLVQIGSVANSFSTGTYTATLNFTNSTNGADDTSHLVKLTVLPPPDDPYGPNSDPASAYGLTECFSSLPEGNATKGEYDDWYVMQVTSLIGLLQVNATFTHADGDIDLHLYTSGLEQAQLISDLTLIDESVTANDVEQVLAYDAEPGWYYILVDGPNSHNQYGLTANCIMDDLYEQNDSQGEAFDLTESEGELLSSVNGNGVQLDDDWFEIVADADTGLFSIALTFTHANGNLSLELRNSGGALVASADTSTDNESINYTVPSAGTYYIVVKGSNTGNTYDLQWEAIREDHYEENDTLGTYYDLTDYENTLLSEIDGFGFNLDDDWFGFDSGTGGDLLRVELLFTHADGNLRMEITDSLGNPIAASSTSTDNEYVAIASASGEYRIRVQGPAIGTQYDLRWFIVADDDYGDNNNMNDATDLTVYDGGGEDGEDGHGLGHDGNDLGNIDGNGVNTDDDWYMIHVREGALSMQVDAEFIHTLGNIDIYLYDSNGVLIGSGESLTDNESIFYNLPPEGDYYIQVVGDNSGNEYNLSWVVIYEDNYGDDNDSLTSATDLTAFQNGCLSQINGLGIQGDTDVFKIAVPEGMARLNVTATFTHADGNIDIELLNSSGTSIAVSNSTEDTESIGVANPAAGEYYIVVTGDNNGNEYDLCWESLPEDNYDNNSMEDAFDLTPFEEQLLSEVDGEGVQVGEDWYIITLPPGVTLLDVQAFFDHEGGDINIALLDSTGTTVAVSNSTTDDEQILVTNPASGTYYVVVTGDDSGNTYDLTWDMHFDDAYEGDDGNNIQANAYDATLGDNNDTNGSENQLSYIDGMGVQLNDDWYHISVDENSNFLSIDAIFEHAGGNIDIQLYDQNGALLASSLSTTDNEHIGFVLPGGVTDYYIRVTGDNSGNEYDLIWNGYVEDGYNNNDMGNAYDLTGNEGEGLPDGQGVQSGSDWYEICVGPEEDVLEITVTFDHSQGNIDVILYNSAGVEIARAESTTDNEVIVFALPPADPPGSTRCYYIEIIGDDSGNLYDLIWNAYEEDGAEPNDDIGSAYNLTNGVAACLSDPAFLGGPATQLDDDWYQIDVAAGYDSLVIDVTFDHAGGNINVQVFLGDETNLVGAGASQTDNEQVVIMNPNGSYFVRVYGPNNGNQYDLCYELLDDDEYEENDDQTSATLISDGDTSGSITGTQLDDDWYAITLSGDALGISIQALFEHADGDINLTLYDEEGNIIGSAHSTTDNEYILCVDPSLAGQTVYVQVTGDDNGNSYDLEWHEITEDGYEGSSGNNDQASAYDLTGNENQNLSDIDGYGVQLDDDWYQIYVGERQDQLIIDLTFLDDMGDLNLLLYDEYGNLVASSSTDTDNEQIIIDMPSEGYYYIVVTGTNSGNEYDLVWSLTGMLSDKWYFAEGKTDGGFQTYVLVVNPHPTDPTVVGLNILFDNGDAPLTTTRTLAANSRYTFNLGDVISAAGRTQGFVAAELLAEDQALVYAERAMYWPLTGVGVPSTPRMGGTDSIGSVHLDTDWYLAEGTTANDSSGQPRLMIVSVGNPTTRTAQLGVIYLVENGANIEKTFNIPALSRYNIIPNNSDQAPNRHFSTRIQSIGEHPVPVVIERTMYGNVLATGDMPDLPLKWGHTSLGITEPSDIWYFAEGATHSSFDTFFTLANSHPTSITINLRFLLSDGTQVTDQFEIGPATRKTIDVERDYPAQMTDNPGFATVFESENEMTFTAERPQYFTAPGYNSRTGATGVVGMTGTQPSWYLPEGAVWGTSNFECFITVGNPGDTTANVSVEFIKPDSSVVVPAPSPYAVSPGQRLTVKANNFVANPGGTQSISTLVKEIDGKGIIVERVMYWTIDNHPRWEGHASIGIPEFVIPGLSSMPPGEFEK
ncbi:pre-peptidase C-terminal domain-containing protein, partial [Candidatus Sumerlaeota bacterium]|nr:pre-peptidase C-terminal domain-containing protein [Candidatus Sumerlaeota bacterium]